ncbi:conserved hypothetical protein [Flavobacterium sp. 9AF]|uniref:hypothetical protein n=1 Tax=Flavobacterium sp. 9AF TaxID=2653142 RepID=UPI0012F1D27F|nr:hypothetical protein [Flavobacterium sp. 9AF]VXB96129.1 conserved hypothetical protein [Flavobacterium sp. 9AF]
MQKKLHFLLFLGMIVFGTNTYSQEEKNFSQEELHIFVKIYNYQLNHPFDLIDSMQKAFEKTTLSKERMTTLLQAQFAGNEVELTLSEKNELEKIKVAMEKDYALYKTNFNSFITLNKMNPTRYLEIEKYFHSNHDFQNKVAYLYQ